MRVKLIGVAVIIMCMFITGCSKENENPEFPQAGEDFVIKATAKRFDSSEYKMKKGSEINVVMDSKELLSIEIKGLSLKLDKKQIKKVVKFDSAGIYDILGNAGNGKIIKSLLIVE